MASYKQQTPAAERGRRYSLSKYLLVGADAYIGPLQNVSILSEMIRKGQILLRGDVGIAPYDS